MSYSPQELAPVLLLTDKIAFYCLPDPNPDEFKTCLKIQEKKIIDKLGKYIRVWYSETKRLKNREDLEKIDVY